MSLLSFSNVGVRAFDTLREEAQEQSILPIGFKTPLELGQGDSLLAMHTSISEQIADNLRNLILTNHGERLAFFDYGANLMPLASELSSMENFDSEAVIRIKTAVSKWMPFVNLSTYSSAPIYESNEHVGKIGIMIEYSVERIQVVNRRINIILFVM